ncbi:hypothetical protein QMZ05_12790 [Bradyrhizobium sp. INPA03-11B]|uniref:hypothetical protein n=1 Tax=Bradyrhizobium sp. INPA03-11B TaxID=418598 RepID=UPI00338F9293
MHNLYPSGNIIELRPRLHTFDRRRPRSINAGLTCLALTKHNATDKALLVSDNGDATRAVWCPKVMFQIEPGEMPFDFIVATMSSAFAQQKGLGPRFVDRTGWSAEKIAALACVERIAATKRLQYRGFHQPLPFPGRNAFA